MSDSRSRSGSSSLSRRSALIVGVAFGAVKLLLPLQRSLAQSGDKREEWAAVVAAAKKEGKVRFYFEPVQTVGERLVAGFAKAYPDIAVESYRAPGNQLIPRIEQERTSGLDGGDVYITSEFRWIEERLKENSLLRPSAATIARWPARYVRRGSIYIAGIDPLVIIYNTTMVSKRPTSYADLLGPEYKNKIGTTTLAGTGVIADYDWAEKTFGNDYLVRLKAQNPKLYNGGTPLSQAVASGEIAANGIAAVAANAKAMQARGAPVEYVVPNPGTGQAYTIVPLGWSKRPNAARVFADYVMSVDGQTAWHGSGESASPLPGIPGAIDASMITPWDPDNYPPEVVRAFTEHFNSIFK